MNFNNSLQLNQSQKLIMTSQLKQSLNILSMSKIEIEEEIKKASEENPLLEFEKTTEINWEEYIKNIEHSTYIDKGEFSYDVNKEVNLENLIKYSSNLYENLYLQLSLYKLSKEEKKICNYIIDSLDNDGYLRIENSEIIKKLNIDEQQLNKAIEVIQQLEPVGVGARSLAECLIIQMKHRGIDNILMQEIVKSDLDLIAKNKYKEICKKYKISMQKCIEIINEIKVLEPKPVLIYSDDKNLYIQPDVIVEKIDEEFIVYMNERDSIKIKINNFYKEILKNSGSDENAKKFIREKLNLATGLAKNIENRKSTILKIAEEIVSYQKEFFDHGIKYIKPMKMKDLSEKLNFHESTISRGVNGKYMYTPFGMFEFKYFFSVGLENIDDSCTSSISIKKIIQDTIKSEDKRKPLSDEQLSKILKDNGINIARRTIAKYREELGIESSSKRKKK